MLKWTKRRRFNKWLFYLWTTRLCCTLFECNEKFIIKSNKCCGKCPCRMEILQKLIQIFFSIEFWLWNSSKIDTINRIDWIIIKNYNRNTRSPLIFNVRQLNTARISPCLIPINFVNQFRAIIIDIEEIIHTIRKKIKEYFQQNRYNL